ncbi:MAG TPA: zinc-binding dehydrogenase [Chitinophagaceae bacterium]|nr:zinc-binding dehydrogenase [Chitinophagaceae bacterium]
MKNKAIYAKAGKFEIKDAPYPNPKYNEAIVKVTAVSLNRGEVRYGFTRPDEWIPGWDLAGEVVQPAANGGGPQEKTRVVGFLPSGGWAQYVAVPADALAELPLNVSDARAATLPVAGLTALLTISKGGQLLGKRVLITGATGGVGTFAVQLAALSGAHTTALIRSHNDEPIIKELGADEIIYSVDDAKNPFHLVIDSVGGELIGKLINKIVPHGMLVSYGNSSEQPEASYTVTNMYRASVTLYGFILFGELKTETPASALSRLADLVSRNKLKIVIEKEANWTEIQQVAHDLMDRRFKGKAVLKVS